MGFRSRALGRTFALLSGLCLLSACVAQPRPGGYAAVPVGGTFSQVSTPGPMNTPSGRRVAVLVPLTGPGADLGQSLLRGARLALDTPGGPPFDAQDTQGTQAGASEAATRAIAAGAGIIVGPLTNADTGAVATAAGRRSVPVLAFTSDGAQARPGVWVMGITPAQQVRALVGAVRAEGKSRFGAVLPRNPFGDALADALVQQAAEGALPAPLLIRYDPGTGVDTALNQVDAAGAAPVDALLLGTSAEISVQILPVLARHGLGPDRVRLLGTALWSRAGTKLAPLAGAWFAAPDPRALETFERNYTARFGAPPREYASIAFDAAGAARAATGTDLVNVGALLNPSGFAGANGVFTLLPDGHVLRALSIMEVGADGPRVRRVAPAS